MGEDGVTQNGLGQSFKHRDLDGRNDFPCLHSESGEPENAITLGIDEGFQKASSLGQRAGAQDRDLGNFRQPISHPALLGFGFTQTDPGQTRDR